MKSISLDMYASRRVILRGRDLSVFGSQRLQSTLYHALYRAVPNTTAWEFWWR